jgi:hypothetical protein
VVCDRAVHVDTVLLEGQKEWTVSDAPEMKVV